MAPADAPPIAMRLGSTPYVVAFARSQRTAACASCWAASAAVSHAGAGSGSPAQPGGASRR